VLDGRAEVRADAGALPLERGSAVLMPNGRAYEIHTGDAATFFRASVPHPL
jgi:ethanolamine utilization protein EutQ (cupin superfamily)